MPDKDGRLTVALDFDGVLHSYSSGWTGPIPFDAPVEGAQGFCQWLVSNKFKVVVMTTRAEHEGAAEGIRAWFQHHGFPEEFWKSKEALSMGGWMRGERWVEVTHEKAHADVYVDDRGWRFNGDFAELREFLGTPNNLKPWNKEQA